jgi:hypothetical protein
MEDKLRTNTECAQQRNSKIEQFTLIISQKWITNSKLLNYCCLLLSIFCSFSYCFFGLDFTDSPFWYSSYIDSSQLNILWFGTTATMRWLTQIFNDDIITYRIMNVIVNYLAILLPLLTLSNKDILNKSWGLIILLSSFYFTSINFNILSADSFTILSISIVYTVSTEHLRTNNPRYLIANCIFVAIATSIRIPNILLIVPLIIGITNQIKNKNTKIRETITLLIGISTIYIALCLILKPIHIINIDNSHNIFNTTIRTFRQLLPILILAVLISLTNWKKINILPIQRFLLNSLLVFFTFFHWWNTDGANWATAHYLIGLIVFPSIILLSKNPISLITFSTYGLIAAAGSNTGMLKIAHGFIFLIPIIIYECLFHFSNSKKKYIISVAIILSSIFTTKILLIGTYEDYSIKALIFNIHSVPKAKIAKTKYIITCKNSNPYLLDAEHIMSKLEGKTLCFGNPNWMLNYIYPGKSISLPMFWQDTISLNQIQIIRKNTEFANCQFILISKSHNFYAQNYEFLKKHFEIYENTKYTTVFRLRKKFRPHKLSY